MRTLFKFLYSLVKRCTHPLVGAIIRCVHGTFVCTAPSFAQTAVASRILLEILNGGPSQQAVAPLQKRRGSPGRITSPREASSSYDWPFLASVQICRMEGVWDHRLARVRMEMTAAAAKPARGGEHKRLDEVRCIIRRQEEQIESLRCENERLKDATGSEAKVSPELSGQIMQSPEVPCKRALSACLLLVNVINLAEPEGKL